MMNLKTTGQVSKAQQEVWESKQRLTDSNRFAGTISLTEEPLEFQARQLSPEQQAARQRSLKRMKHGYPLGIAGMKREQFYD